MKRIVLGLSLLLMLVQNGFAGQQNEEAECDNLIAKAKQEWNKEVLKCDKEAIFHLSKANVKPCLKAIELIKKTPNSKNWVGQKAKGSLGECYLNAGVMYYYVPSYTKSYKYLKKAAELGESNAEKGLDILCREHPWVCK